MTTKLLFLATIIVLFFVTIFHYGCSGEEKTRNNSADQTPYEQIYDEVTPQEAYALIQKNRKNENFVILDVRTTKEFTDAHIENSINIDFYSPSFGDSLTTLDKNKTYMIYCRSGNRSGKTFNKMKSVEFTRLYNMLGGIVKWKEEELPVVE